MVHSVHNTLGSHLQYTSVLLSHNTTWFTLFAIHHSSLSAWPHGSLAYRTVWFTRLQFSLVHSHCNTVCSVCKTPRRTQTAIHHLRAFKFATHHGSTGVTHTLIQSEIHLRSPSKQHMLQHTLVRSILAIFAKFAISLGSLIFRQGNTPLSLPARFTFPGPSLHNG